MGYDQTSHETETGYIRTAWIGEESVTIEVEQDDHFSVAWNSHIPSSGFLEIASQLPAFPTSDAVAYKWSLGRNFDTRGSDLLLELEGLGAEAFSKDYGFLCFDTDDFAISWQIAPLRRETWTPTTSISGQVIMGLASNVIDTSFIYRLFASTHTPNLNDDLADKFLRGELDSLLHQFKEADWSALLAKV